MADDRIEQFSFRIPNDATGNVLMWVCHCAVNWKNLTPVQSTPSTLTAFDVKQEERRLFIDDRLTIWPIIELAIQSYLSVMNFYMNKPAYECLRSSETYCLDHHGLFSCPNA